MWLANVPKANTANGLTLLFANITNMDTATKGTAVNTRALSAVKPPGSPQKNEVDPWKRLLKEKRGSKKSESGGSPKDKSKHKNIKESNVIYNSFSRLSKYGELDLPLVWYRTSRSIYMASFTYTLWQNSTKMILEVEP